VVITVALSAAFVRRRSGKFIPLKKAIRIHEKEQKDDWRSNI
jgi:hypothetical protein